MDNLFGLTAMTLDQVQKLGGAIIAKSGTAVTTASGLTFYELQAPAKNLYPVYTPIRNALPRTPGMGPATNWKSVTGLSGSGYDAVGFVPEGQRAGAMSITVA